MQQSLLVLFSFLFAGSTCLLCNQCGGERYSGGLRLLRGMCCNVSTIECDPGLICIRAVVVSPRSSFILSGCHVPEDEMIGCDFHHLPHNATIHRCVCVDQACQSYFPTGNCSSSISISATVTEVKSRPNPHQRKSHALTTATAAPPKSTTSTAAPFTLSPKLARKELHHAERREPLRYENSQRLWQFPYSALVILGALLCSFHWL